MQFFYLHWAPLQIKNFFSRYKKATGAANTANVPVAAIDSVEMDAEEEDSMLEAIQGPYTLDLTNWNFNSHLLIAMHPISLYNPRILWCIKTMGII